MGANGLKWRAGLKRGVSWLMIALQVVLSIFGLAMVYRLSSPTSGFWNYWIREAAFSFVLTAIPLLATVRGLWDRKQAGLILLIAAPVLGALVAAQLVLAPDDPIAHRGIVAFVQGSSWFFVPAAFWILTSRAGWPPLLLLRSPSNQRLWVAGPLFFVTYLTLGLIAHLYLVLPYAYIAECGQGLPPVSAPRFPGQAVFTARIVLRGPSLHSYPSTSWSVARVERQLWGVPWWASRFVILRGYFDPITGPEYFVDGMRSSGLLTRFLPIIEFYPCGRSQPLNWAGVDLRTSHEGPPKSGVRIIGSVYDSETWSRKLVTGSEVLITGPRGSFTVTTDQEGIYDVSDLPEGHYTIQVEPETRRPHFGGSASADIKQGEIWGARLVQTAPH